MPTRSSSSIFTALSLVVQAVTITQPAVAAETRATLNSGEAVGQANVRTIWRINVGDRISDAFRAWAKQTKTWQVTWEAPELIAEATADVEGSFEDATSKVIEALNRGDAGLIGRFYVDPANQVLRIMERR